MAIQISGTQVISNSRGLTNIASVDATTVATLNAGGVGGGGVLPYWDPAATPNVNFTSSGTWTKPTLDDDTYVIFYMVGGGSGAGKYFGLPTGNEGGRASVVAATAGALPSSVTITVGAGGAGTYAYNVGVPGGSTKITANSIAYETFSSAILNNGTSPVIFTFVGNPFEAIYPAVAGMQSGIYPNPNGNSEAGRGSFFAGGQGGGSGTTAPAKLGGPSVYAGAGGNGNIGVISGANGVAPGGGGGMQTYYENQRGGNGAQGSVRVYYLTA